jgi:hypothetical protein
MRRHTRRRRWHGPSGLGCTSRRWDSCAVRNGLHQFRVVQSDEAVGAAGQAAELRGLDFDGAWRFLRPGENGVVALPRH